MRVIFLHILFLFFTNIIYGQSFESFFSKNYHKPDTSVLSIDIENANFLKNNEFFGNMVEGYTLIGYFLKPKIVYSPFKKIKLEGGFHLQKYSGIDKFAEISPIFSFKYLPTDKLEIVFGTINGTVNHNLPDPILYSESYLTENIENGIQFLYKGKRFQSDTWIDWRQFILKGSAYPEIFYAGTSNKIKLFQIFKKHDFFVKLAATASHIGGQINISSEPVETFINTSAGLEFNINTKNNFLKNIKFESSYLISYDFSPEKRLEYLYGYGILSGIELNGSFFNLKLQHWFSEYFFTKFGNPIYQSISSISKDYYEDERALIKGELFLNKKIYKGIYIGFGAEAYYNLYDGSFNYLYGVYIKSDFNFILKKSLKK